MSSLGRGGGGGVCHIKGKLKVKVKELLYLSTVFSSVTRGTSYKNTSHKIRNINYKKTYDKLSKLLYMRAVYDEAIALKDAAVASMERC